MRRAAEARRRRSTLPSSLGSTRWSAARIMAASAPAIEQMALVAATAEGMAQQAGPHPRGPAALLAVVLATGSAPTARPFHASRGRVCATNVVHRAAAAEGWPRPGEAAPTAGWQELCRRNGILDLSAQGGPDRCSEVVASRQPAPLRVQPSSRLGRARPLFACQAQVWQPGQKSRRDGNLVLWSMATRQMQMDSEPSAQGRRQGAPRGHLRLIGPAT